MTLPIGSFSRPTIICDAGAGHVTDERPDSYVWNQLLCVTLIIRVMTTLVTSTAKTIALVSDHISLREALGFATYLRMGKLDAQVQKLGEAVLNLINARNGEHVEEHPQYAALKEKFETIDYLCLGVEHGECGRGRMEYYRPNTKQFRPLKLVNLRGERPPVEGAYFGDIGRNIFI